MPSIRLFRSIARTLARLWNPKRRRSRRRRITIDTLEPRMLVSAGLVVDCSVGSQSNVIPGWPTTELTGSR